MFKESELRLIEESYFKLLSCNPFCVTIRSRNTGHFWHIVVKEYKTYRSFEIWHRHGTGGEYHLHGHAGSFEKVLISIREHDEFQRNGRKK